MRRLVRAPLTWMIVAECVVVGTLLLVAWHVIAGVAAPGHAAPLSFPAVEASPADAALPAAGGTSAGGKTHGPPPGLNVGVGFLRPRLPSLQPGQGEFAGHEVTIAHTGDDAG